MIIKIISFIHKYKLEILFGLFILSLYFFLRFYHILTLPPFTDEEIYIRWSQIANNDANWRFISLTDGKQPMFVWIAIVIMHRIGDPLFAGRLVSVFAGLVTTVGFFFLGSETFKSRWVGILSSFIYVVYPFGLVYDRMALYDSLVGAFMVWILYVEILLVRRIRSDIAFILGLVLGGGLLTKTNTLFGIYLLPSTLLLFNFKSDKKMKKLFEWAVFAILAVVLAQVYYSVLRLSPFYNIIANKNDTFVYPIKEWLGHPFTFLYGNLRGLFDWFVIYLRWPLIILIVGSFLWIKNFFREKVLLIAWFIVPFVALALFGKVLYPRFILFMTLPLLPLMAYTLYKLTSYIKIIPLKILIVLLFMTVSIYTDYFIITDFPHAPIALPDSYQYSNDWPAGGGVREMIAFFSMLSKKEKIYVATEGTFGSVPTLALEIYLDQNKNIQKRGIWPIPDKIPQDLIDKAKHMPVYFVFNRNQTPPVTTWPIKLIVQYRKGIGDAKMRIYQVLPSQ